MFRILCISLTVLAAGTAVAQVKNNAAKPGSWMVSGSAAMDYYLSSSSGEDTPNKGFQLSLYPRVLYFAFMPGLGLGIDGHLGWYKNSYTNTSIGIGPRVAYYVRMENTRYPSGCCLTPFVGRDGWWLPFAGASFLYLTESNKYGQSTTTANGWLFKAGLGVSPLIGTHGTMPVELGFRTESMTSGEGESESTAKSSGIYLEVGFGAFLWK